MNNFVFNNQFVFNNKKVMNGVLLKFLMILVLIIVGLKISFDGFSFMALFIGLFAISTLLPRGTATFKEFCPTRVEIGADSIKITYMNLDRHDKTGRRTEDYLIQSGDISEIKYEEEKSKLIISGKPMVTITSEKNEPLEKNYKFTDEFCKNELFLTDEIKVDMLQAINELCVSKEMSRVY